MKKAAIFIIIAVLILSLNISVLADYRYNAFNEPVETRESFTAVHAINGIGLGIGEFKNPADIYVDDNNKVYIMDNGNNRIVILNEELTFEKEITPSGFTLEAAGGMFVCDEDIFIANSEDEKIYVINFDGETVREISRPESVLLGDAAFIPKKVLVDEIGTVYMLSDNSTQGAYMIDSDNSFLGFYGRNDVLLTFERMMEVTARQFASKEQREGMQNFIPVEFANFDIDDEGFIYTVTAYSENPESDQMIRKLNPMGDNVLLNLSSRTWGDNKDGDKYNTSYVDIAVDKDGFTYALDGYGGKLFWYDNNLCQICVFGGSGNVLGRFTTPVAVEVQGENVLVLDSTKCSLTVFEKTHFGSLMTEGRLLYNEGYFKESREIFQEIITMDPKCDYAWAALGAAYYEDGDNAQAKEFFEKSKSALDKYSEVKKELRNDWMKEHFAVIFIVIILLALIVIAASKLIAAKMKEGRI